MNLCLVDLALRRITKGSSHLFSRLIFPCVFLLGAIGFHLISVHLNLNERDSAEVRSTVYIVFIAMLVFATVGQAGGVLRNLASFFPNERRQKTLPFLFMTPLTNWEILLGKLVGDLWEPIWILTATAPIGLYLSAYADYDPRLLIAVYMVIVSTLFFIGSFSLYFSPTTSESSSKSQGFAGLWLFLLMFFPAMIKFGGLYANHYFFQRVVHPINEWLYPLNPLSIAIAHFTTSNKINSNMFCYDIYWAILLQTTYGLILLYFKARRLRLDYQRSFGAASTNRSPRLWIAALLPQGGRKIKRRSLGLEDAMIWKETSRSRGLYGPYQWVLIASLFYFTGAYRLIYMNSWDHALIGSISREFLRYGSIAMFFLTRSAASTAIVAERSAKTWESLIVTELTPREIIRGKIIGALLSHRTDWLILFVISAILCVIGELHWLSWILFLSESVVFSWFASSIGVFVSLITAHDASSNDRLDERSSLLSTMILIAQNVFILIGSAPLLFFIKFRPSFYIGFIPAIVFATIVPRETASRMLNLSNNNSILNFMELMFTWIATIGIDMLLSRGLFRASVVRFDAIVGRPRRNASSRIERTTRDRENVEPG